jgi:hypothetical protein
MYSIQIEGSPAALINHLREVGIVDEVKSTDTTLILTNGTYINKQECNNGEIVFHDTASVLPECIRHLKAMASANFFRARLATRMSFQDFVTTTGARIKLGVAVLGPLLVAPWPESRRDIRTRRRRVLA